MRNNLSQLSSNKVTPAPILNQSNSFKNLGNSIINQSKLNSFTVKNIQAPNEANSSRKASQSIDPFFGSKDYGSTPDPFYASNNHLYIPNPSSVQENVANAKSNTSRSQMNEKSNVKSPLDSSKRLENSKNISYYDQDPHHNSRNLNSQNNPNTSRKTVPIKSPTSEKTALKYLKREIKPLYPPSDYKFSIFAIYAEGNSYDTRKRSYGMPTGIGVLINEHLCLTAASVFSDENSVISSFMQLRDGSVFKFDPYRAFVKVQDQFCVVAFHIKEAKVLEKFRPIDLSVPFELTEDDPVFYFPLDTNRQKKILVINNDFFTISSGRPETLLPGNPIFTVDWQIQGIFVQSEGHINNVLKIRPIFEYLESSMPLFKNPILDKFLHQDTPGFVEKFHDRLIYYCEWGTRKIWSYDIDQKKWKQVKIHNFEEFSQDFEYWSFGENSRLLYLPSGSVLCIGGVSKSTTISLNDVYEFCPQEYHVLKKLPDMQVPRTGLACVYIENYVYVVGGLPHAQTCEKFSMASQKWLPLASMFYPRTNASATSALGSEFIFVFGGEPLSPSGTSIEKYSVKFNHWELLSVYLPIPLAKIGIFPITDRRIAILGGTDSNHVFILNVNDTLHINGIEYTTQTEKKTYTIQDCLRSLENITETVFPVAFSRTENVLFIMNSYKSHPSDLSFSIEEFSVEYFEITTHVDFTHKPYEVIAKVRTPYDLGRNWKNDDKLRMIK